jgi:hypothetical protein
MITKILYFLTIVGTVVLYSISAIIVFIILCFKSNSKKTSYAFGYQNNYTNSTGKSRWPTQYIQYAKDKYSDIIWGGELNFKHFSNFANSKNASSENKTQKNIQNLSPVPINKEFLTSRKDTPSTPHADNVSQEKPSVNQKRT